MPKKKKFKLTTKAKKTINLALALLIITLSTSLVGYIFVFNDEYKKQEKVLTTDKKVHDEELKLDEYRKERIAKYYEKKIKFEEYTKELEKEYTYKIENNKVIKEEIEKRIDEIEAPTKIVEVAKENIEPKTIIEKIKAKVIPTKEEKKEEVVVKEEKAVIDSRPKLAIVIDDVTARWQVKALTTLGYKVNLSFLPPTKRHPNSAKIAQKLPFYMIHFPMQASSFKFEEEHTLHIGDSYEKIENRVAQLRKWYPKAIYTNNHTGSKFTANLDGMDKVYRALKKYDFIFVDSRTTSKTVAPKLSKKYNMPFLSRNIFLDNKHDFTYIRKQLKKAVRIAHRDGFAIAIGHPHKKTIETLRKSKDLLEGLNIVYVNELH